MLEKLQSRKLWITVIFSLLYTIADQLGIDNNNVKDLIPLLASYILGQSIVDFKSK